MPRPLLMLPLVLALAACTSTPAPLASGLEAPAGEYGAAEVVATGPADAVALWRGFDDPVLSDLVSEALHHNHDLRITLARYDQARAVLRESRSDRRPAVTAHAGAANQRLSRDQAPTLDRDQRDGDSFHLQIEAGWELDFFGRVRHAVAASRAEADAAAADAAAARIAVVGELAASYFQLRGLQQQLAVAVRNADNQDASLQLLQAWEDAGRGNRLDSARGGAQLALTRARVPALQADISRHIHRIAVLTGRPPDALRTLLSESAPIPALPDQVAAGAPGELLRRRPDIRAAEQRLAAASARVGIATADLFPRFTLGGLIGSQAARGGALLERDSETRLLRLGIDWSFLDVGRMRARLAAAEAGAGAALAQYEQTVLQALEEAETALARYARVQQETRQLEDAVTLAAEATALARLRFENGAVGYIEVLDAERTALDSDDRLAEARTRGGLALVAVYRALAGSWPERIATAAVP